MLPGNPAPSLYSGSFKSVCGVDTVTCTSTVSVEPSGYVTFTGTVMTSPGVAPSGTTTLNDPFGFTVTPSGALSPASNFVFSGTSTDSPVVGFVNVGAPISTVLPGNPAPSLYSGSFKSAITKGSAEIESSANAVPVEVVLTPCENTPEV